MTSRADTTRAPLDPASIRHTSTRYNGKTDVGHPASVVSSPSAAPKHQPARHAHFSVKPDTRFRYVDDPIDGEKDLLSDARPASSLPLPIQPHQDPTSLPDRSKQCAHFDITTKSRNPESDLKAVAYTSYSVHTGTLAKSFSWDGAHPEDLLTENVVKNGYSGKGHLSSESSSARPALWPHLKNKSAIPSLSVLFTSLLVQRQHSGRLSASSSFKPPPRVTLTDTKREAWLRDLANASVPLRRLSRTIPHGIRGRVLLDHCMIKVVPYDRAIWLAKCVGANETRAFRRKGISGPMILANELKWLKEWTSQFHDFLEGVFSDLGQQASNEHFTYALQLSTHLYSQSLLDVEHFLGWLLDLTEKCSLNILPALVLSIRLYWIDLVAVGRRGWRLANALLFRICQLSESPDMATFEALASDLRLLLQKLILDCPWCCLMQENWSLYRQELVVMTSNCPCDTEMALQQVLRRNDRLAPRKSQAAAAKSFPCGTIGLLDRLERFAGVDEMRWFAADLPALHDHGTSVMVKILTWSSTVYSCSPSRPYIVSSLIRDWRNLTIDTDHAFLEALELLQNNDSISARPIGRIIAHLVQSAHFSVGRYLQWIIAVGALNGKDSDRMRTSCAVRPLIDIPLLDLPSHVINLRRTLLRSVNISTDLEADVISLLKINIAQHLPNLLTLNDASTMEPLTIDPSAITLTITSEIKSWILQSFKQARDSVVREPSQHANVITYSGFACVRQFFEQAEDLSALADILLAIVSDLNCEDILGAIIDSLLAHIDVFQILDVANAIFLACIDRYRSVRNKRPPQKDLVTKLLLGADRLAVGVHLVTHLQRDLFLCDDEPFQAACSPVSDSMVEDAREDSENFAEQIEKALASGNTIDGNTFSNAFKLIFPRLESFDTSHSEISSLTLSLTRLKTLDEDRFDNLFMEWLRVKVLDTNCSPLQTAIPAAIGGGVVSLTTCMKYCAIILDETSRESVIEANGPAINLLSLFTEPNNSAETVISREIYRFRVERHNYVKESPGFVLRLLDLALIRHVEHVQKLLSSPLLQEAGRSAARQFSTRMISQNPLLVKAEFLMSFGNLITLWDRLLDPLGRFGFTSLTANERVTAIFERLDEFSLPYCLACLAITTSGLGRDESTSPCEPFVLLDSVRASITRHSQLWPRLISILDPNVLTPLREYAEGQILMSCGHALGSPLNELNSARPFNDLDSSLQIANASANPDTEANSPRLAQNLFLHLKALVPQSSHKQPAMLEANFTRIPILDEHFDALLQLVLLHATSFKSNKSGLTDCVTLLLVLCHLIAEDAIEASDLIYALPEDARQYLFDVAAFFAADLSETELVQIRRQLLPLAHDPRIRFLFGFLPNSDAWLCVAQSTSDVIARAMPILSPEGSVRFQALPIRKWELLSDAAPNIGENDTAVSLRQFDARRVL